jgi:hypothetical protein
VAAVLASAGCGGSSTSSSAKGTTGAPATVATTGAGAASSGDAGSGSGTTVSLTLDGVTARMHGSSHTPRANQGWPVQYAVTAAGRPLAASVSYAYLLAGQVVGRRSHYRFTGHFADTLVFPPAAVGYPLTFRSIIMSGGLTFNLDYPVQVTR